MAINLPSFLGYGPRETGYSNTLRHADMAAKQAYSPQREQQQIQIQQQELQKEQLMNALRSMQNQYAPQRFEQEEEQLRLANFFNQSREPYADQIAQQEAMPKTGDLGQLFRDMEIVNNVYGPDSPQAQAAQEFVKAKITPSQGMQVNVDPKTGAVSFSSSGTPGAGSGSVGGRGSAPIIGPDGQLLYAPTSTTESKVQSQQLSKAAFDVFNENVNQPYVGKGSNKRLRKDITEYEKTKDPELFQKLSQTALAYKLTPEIALTSLQLSDTPVTQKSIAEQEKSIKQGWPEFGSYFTNNLPSEIQQAVNERYNEILNQAHNVQTGLAKSYFANPLSENLNQKNIGNQRQNTYNPNYLDEDLIFTSKQTGKPIEEIIAILESKRA